jgi:hypothetical protein
MKAIIELSHKGSIFGAVKQQIADAAQGQPIDYHLGFESARALFSDLTPARLDLLDTLRRMGGVVCMRWRRWPIEITRMSIRMCRGCWSWG